MKVQVTQEDIDRGRRNDGRNCALAKAIRRHDRSLNAVGTFFVQFTSKRYVALPMPAYDWMNAYDAGDLVEPIEFDLDLDNLCEVPG